MNLINVPTRRINAWAAKALALAVLSAALGGGAIRARAADSVTEKVNAATSEAEKQLQETSQAAESKITELWRRIDERRLKHRTPDQIVAWIIMGLLVGGLIHQFSKLNKVATLLLGLGGAFLGGIVANVVQLNLGLGPVLIRYEDLLASLVGGVVIVIVARLLATRRSPKT